MLVPFLPTTAFPAPALPFAAACPLPLLADALLLDSAAPPWPPPMRSSSCDAVNVDVVRALRRSCIGAASVVVVVVVVVALPALLPPPRALLSLAALPRVVRAALIFFSSGSADIAAAAERFRVVVAILSV